MLGWLLLLPCLAAAAWAPRPLASLSREALLATGRTRLADALAALLPSLNAPHPSGAGGADHVQPLTLRGQGADQLLVLVNGVPRQPSALVPVDAAVGRGQPLADLAAIPLSAVARVDLYGGDAARFGFGAVAGVLDVILLADVPGEVAVRSGLTTAGDGAELVAGGRERIALGSRGFLEAMGELAGRSPTNRAEPDPRPQYFAGDPRNNNPPRVDERFGEPRTRSFAAFLNTALGVGGGVTAYGVAGWSIRQSTAGERWRTAADDQTVRALYPNGYLPLIEATLQDGSGLAGARGRFWGWSWDARAGYARSSVRYELTHSVNPSLGVASPARFQAGILRADQFRSDFGLSRRLPTLGGLPALLLELGGSYRNDGYQIEAGEPDSYRYGAVPILDGPHAGAIAPIGAQGFTALLPSEALVRRRKMGAGSAALSTTVSGRLDLTAAGRVEAYPSLGTIGVTSFSGELRPARGFALRASYGTGARVAPLAQSWYSSTATSVIGPFGFQDRTVPIADPLAVVLGAKRLNPERSSDLELGGTLTRVPHLTLEANVYRLRGEHRIILSGSFDDPAVLNFLAQQGFPGIRSVRFFANALATRTTGVEASAGYGFTWRSAAVTASAAWHHATTHVALSDSVPGLLALFTQDLFDRTERARQEQGQPRDNLILAIRAIRARWDLHARAERYGAISGLGAPPDGSLDQRYGARWLADLGARYAAGRRLSLELRVENLLDTVPEQNRYGDAASEGNSRFGMRPYPGDSPFGFSGRRLTLGASWR